MPSSTSAQRNFNDLNLCNAPYSETAKIATETGLIISFRPETKLGLE